MKKDNSTLRLKVSLRRKLLNEIENPIAMETHGGYGTIWSHCYFNIEQGVVFEKNSQKVECLARQRPTWSVYEADCVRALIAGAGNHLPVNFVDIDPYGEPWPAIDAFFESKREFPSKLIVVVNDGLRQKVGMGGGWNVASLINIVHKYDAAIIYKQYIEICRELVQEKAGQCGYTLTRWAGYYCGYCDQMTHYAAVLTK